MEKKYCPIIKDNCREKECVFWDEYCLFKGALKAMECIVYLESIANKLKEY